MYREIYLKCLIIYSYFILNCCAMQLIVSPGPPSKYDYNLNNQNSIPVIGNTVSNNV